MPPHVIRFARLNGRAYRPLDVRTLAGLNDRIRDGEIPMAIYMVEKVVDNVLLLAVRGRITLGPETEALRAKLKQLLDAGQMRIILDLGEVTYLDSVGLGTLTSSYTTARNMGGDLKLLHLPRGVHQLLQVTRLSTVFEIYEDLEAARQSFAPKNP